MYVGSFDINILIMIIPSSSQSVDLTLYMAIGSLVRLKDNKMWVWLV